jgi:SlyX protein
MNDSIVRLEEKIAYLEHHVTAQDKAMLEMAEDIARLRKELKQGIERLAAASETGGDAASAASERPPHY